MEIYLMKGKVYKVLPIQEKSVKFRKQEVIIQETNPTDKGTFVEFIRLQCINDKIRMLEDVKKGDFAICKFSISGRKVGEKDDETFYTNLDVVEFKVVNKTTDIIKDEIRPNSFADRFPGINEEEDDILSEKTTGVPEVEDDLPF
jgi:hypothetical protein